MSSDKDESKPVTGCPFFFLAFPSVSFARIGISDWRELHLVKNNPTAPPRGHLKCPSVPSGERCDAQKLCLATLKQSILTVYSEKSTTMRGCRNPLTAARCNSHICKLERCVMRLVRGSSSTATSPTEAQRDENGQ